MGQERISGEKQAGLPIPKITKPFALINALICLCRTPSVDHDLASKLLPWREYVARGGETASERLLREHAERGYYCPLRVPKVRVYHPSTWKAQEAR